MALTVETGSIVAGANSYASVAEARAYATARGVTLPVGDPAVEVLMIRAMDWLESLRAQYPGTKVSATQPLQFPRVGVYVDGFLVAETEIPAILKSAQCQVAVDLNDGIDPLATYTAEPAVIREKVDVLETQYSEVSVDQVPYLRKAHGFLRPLLSANTPLLGVLRI